MDKIVDAPSFALSDRVDGNQAVPYMWESQPEADAESAIRKAFADAWKRVPASSIVYVVEDDEDGR